MRSKNNYINEAIKEMRYAVFYKGQLVKRFAFYKGGRDYCMKHNHGKNSLPFPEVEDICELIDLQTGETLNNYFSAEPSQ